MDLAAEVCTTNALHVERWRSGERRGAEHGGTTLTGQCLCDGSYVVGGVVARGDGGRRASVGLGPGPGLSAHLQG